MRSLYEVKGIGGSVTFDGAFVAIRHTGFLGRASVGKGEKRIPIRHITAIQMKPAGAVMSGFIQFTLGGGVERRSQFGRQSWDAAGDENSVMFTREQQPEFEQLRAAIEQQIGQGGAPPLLTHPPARPQGPPAGWYPDPQGVTRWWDSYQWTEHTQPVGPRP